MSDISHGSFRHQLGFPSRPLPTLYHGRCLPHPHRAALPTWSHQRGRARPHRVALPGQACWRQPGVQRRADSAGAHSTQHTQRPHAFPVLPLQASYLCWPAIHVLLRRPAIYAGQLSMLQRQSSGCCLLKEAPTRTTACICRLSLRLGVHASFQASTAVQFYGDCPSGLQ